MAVPSETVPVEKIPAGDRKTLLSLAGHKARVQGRVSRIGALPDGRITFINFEGNDREDFVAIVREGSLPALNKQFPDGLDQALTGREVTIEGLVTLFRSTPQIEIENPAQIAVAP
jgi:DNA/RNA endonuclease YhcR with UshA esterase domain